MFSSKGHTLKDLDELLVGELVGKRAERPFTPLADERNKLVLVEGAVLVFVHLVNHLLGLLRCQLLARRLLPRLDQLLVIQRAAAVGVDLCEGARRGLARQRQGLCVVSRGARQVAHP